MDSSRLHSSERARSHSALSEPPQTQTSRGPRGGHSRAAQVADMLGRPRPQRPASRLARQRADMLGAGASNTQGQPLSPGLVQRALRAFGVDLSDVIVTEEPGLATQGKRGAAQDGNVIRVAPGLLADETVLWEEIAHIVQQRNGGGDSVNSLEAEASKAAEAGRRGESFDVRGGADGEALYQDEPVAGGASDDFDFGGEHFLIRDHIIYFEREHLASIDGSGVTKPLFIAQHVDSPDYGEHGTGAGGEHADTVKDTNSGEDSNGEEPILVSIDDADLLLAVLKHLRFGERREFHWASEDDLLSAVESGEINLTVNVAPRVPLARLYLSHLYASVGLPAELGAQWHVKESQVALVLDHSMLSTQNGDSIDANALDSMSEEHWRRTFHAFLTTTGFAAESISEILTKERPRVSVDSSRTDFRSSIVLIISDQDMDTWLATTPDEVPWSEHRSKRKTEQTTAQQQGGVAFSDSVNKEEQDWALNFLQEYQGLVPEGMEKKKSPVRVNPRLIKMWKKIADSEDRSALIEKLKESESTGDGDSSLFDADVLQNHLNEIEYQRHWDRLGMDSMYGEQEAEGEGQHYPATGEIVNLTGRIMFGEKCVFAFEPAFPTEYYAPVTIRWSVIENDEAGLVISSNRFYIDGKDDPSEGHFEFQLDADNKDGHYVIHAFVSHASYRSTHFQLPIAVRSGEEHLKEQEQEAFAGMGSYETTDEVIGENFLNVDYDYEVLRGELAAKRDETSASDWLDKQLETLESMTDNEAYKDQLGAIEKRISLLEKAQDELEARGNEEDFQVRGAFVGNGPGAPDANLQLAGTRKKDGDDWVVTVIDYTEITGTGVSLYEGSEGTFEAALADVFDDMLATYPKGNISILADDTEEGKTIGFRGDATTDWKEFKEVAFEPVANIAVNTAGIIASLAFPPAAPFLIPVLTAYNVSAPLDEVLNLHRQGKLVSAQGAMRGGEVLMELIPMAGAFKPLAKGYWVLEMGGNLAEGVILTADVYFALQDVAQGAIKDLVALEMQLQQLKGQTGLITAMGDRGAAARLNSQIEQLQTQIESTKKSIGDNQLKTLYEMASQGGIMLAQGAALRSIAGPASEFGQRFQGEQGGSPKAGDSAEESPNTGDDGQAPRGSELSGTIAEALNAKGLENLSEKQRANMRKTIEGLSPELEGTFIVINPYLKEGETKVHYDPDRHDKDSIILEVSARSFRNPGELDTPPQLTKLGEHSLKVHVDIVKQARQTAQAYSGLLGRIRKVLDTLLNRARAATGTRRDELLKEINKLNELRGRIHRELVEGELDPSQIATLEAARESYENDVKAFEEQLKSTSADEKGIGVIASKGVDSNTSHTVTPPVLRSSWQKNWFGALDEGLQDKLRETPGATTLLGRGLSKSDFDRLKEQAPSDKALVDLICDLASNHVNPKRLDAETLGVLFDAKSDARRRFFEHHPDTEDLPSAEALRAFFQEETRLLGPEVNADSTGGSPELRAALSADPTLTHEQIAFVQAEFRRGSISVAGWKRLREQFGGREVFALLNSEAMVARRGEVLAVLTGLDDSSLHLFSTLNGARRELFIEFSLMENQPAGMRDALFSDPHLSEGQFEGLMEVLSEAPVSLETWTSLRVVLPGGNLAKLLEEMGSDALPMEAISSLSGDSATWFRKMGAKSQKKLLDHAAETGTLQVVEDIGSNIDALLTKTPEYPVLHEAGYPEHYYYNTKEGFSIRKKGEGGAGENTADVRAVRVTFKRKGAKQGDAPETVVELIEPGQAALEALRKRYEEDPEILEFKDDVRNSNDDLPVLSDDEKRGVTLEAQEHKAKTKVGDDVREGEASQVRSYVEAVDALLKSEALSDADKGLLRRELQGLLGQQDDRGKTEYETASEAMQARINEMDRVRDMNLGSIRRTLREYIKPALYRFCGLKDSGGSGKSKYKAVEPVGRNQSKDGLVELPGDISEAELKKKRAAAHKRLKNVINELQEASKHNPSLVNNEFGTLGEYWYEAWVLEPELRKRAGEDYEREVTFSAKDNPSVEMMKGDGEKQRADYAQYREEHDIDAVGQSYTLREGLFIEVKSGTGVLSGKQIKQLNTYIEMVSDIALTDNKGNHYKPEGVRYTFLHPEGGRANLDVFWDLMLDGQRISVELFSTNGQRKVVNPKTITKLKKKNWDKSRVKKWLAEGGEKWPL